MKRKSETPALSRKRQKIKNKGSPVIELLKTLRANLDQNLSFASCNNLLHKIIFIIESTDDTLKEDMQEELIKLSDLIFTHLDNMLASAPKTPEEFKFWLSTQLSTEDVESYVKSMLFNYGEITTDFLCGRRLSAANLDLLLTLIVHATTIEPETIIDELVTFNYRYFTGLNVQPISSLLVRVARFGPQNDLNAETINNILDTVSSLVKHHILAGKIESKTITDLLVKIGSLPDLKSKYISNSLNCVWLLATHHNLQGAIPSKAITDLLEKLNSLACVTNEDIANCLDRIGDIAKNGHLAGAIESGLLTDLLNKIVPNNSDVNLVIYSSLEGIVALFESGRLAGRIEPETLNALFAKSSCLSLKFTSNFHNGIGSLAQTDTTKNNSAVSHSLAPLKILSIFSNSRLQASAPPAWEPPQL